MRCSTSAVGLGTPELLPALVAASLHLRTSTGRGISLKFSIVADRRTLSASRRVHHIASCLAHLGRRADIANGDVSFRRFFVPSKMASSLRPSSIYYRTQYWCCRQGSSCKLYSYRPTADMFSWVVSVSSSQIQLGYHGAGIFTLPLSFLPQY